MSLDNVSVVNSLWTVNAFIHCLCLGHNHTCDVETSKAILSIGLDTDAKNYVL